MKLAHYTLESPIIFEEGFMQYLVVENQRQLSKYITEMVSEVNGIGDWFILSHEGKTLEFARSVELIINPFSLNPNTASATNNLIQRMKENAFNENQLKTDEMISLINSTISLIAQNQHSSVVFSENIDIPKLLKFMGIGFEQNCESLLESICEYISIKSEYSQILLFIFVNPRCFLDQEELEEFYKFLTYSKINVLLIENRSFSPKSPEKIRIIDEDLCEIGEEDQKY